VGPVTKGWQSPFQDVDVNRVVTIVKAVAYF
jgi:hypothetical protein